MRKDVHNQVGASNILLPVCYIVGLRGLKILLARMHGKCAQIPLEWAISPSCPWISLLISIPSSTVKPDRLSLGGIYAAWSP